MLKSSHKPTKSTITPHNKQFKQARLIRNKSKTPSISSILSKPQRRNSTTTSSNLQSSKQHPQELFQDSPQEFEFTEHPSQSPTLPPLQHISFPSRSRSGTKFRTNVQLDLLPEQAPASDLLREPTDSILSSPQTEIDFASLKAQFISGFPADICIPKPNPRLPLDQIHHKSSKHSVYIDPPDENLIQTAIKDSTSEEGKTARKNILKYFRDAGRQSDLIKPSIDVPYLLPIGESSATTYPIPEYLFHTLYHLSGTTVANYGMGMSASQVGLNYRMFVIRSEVFGHASPISGIPYVLETTDKTHCLVPPRRIQRTYPKPLTFEHTALAWDNPTPELDNISRPSVNLSLSMVDYHDIDGDNAFIESRGGLIYHLQKNLPMPIRDEKQLNLCDDRILLADDQYTPPVNARSRSFGNSKNNPQNDKVITNNSFINEYRGYSVPLMEIERPMFLPLLSAFQQQAGGTAVINPRITQIRYEYASFREGCFSFPQWNVFVSRPIAVDVEFETFDIEGAQIPSSSGRETFNSSLLSAPLAAPVGSLMRFCPTLAESNLDPNFVTPDVTKQLEISRILPKPEHVKLATRKVTLRDLFAKVFLHEYDHLDGIQYFDRASGVHLSWQPPLRNVQAEPSAKYEFPVGIGKAYF